MKTVYENLCFAVGLLLVGSSFANDNPVYTTSRAELEIPSVRVGNTAGVYQNIRMTFAENGTLQMQSVQQGVLLDQISQVEVFRALTVPEQIFLDVSGDFPSGCGDIGQIQHNLEDRQFSIHIYYKNDAWLKNPALVPCTLAMRPFRQRIALDVFGLPAGEYQYTVNNQFSGSFTLMTDNLPD